MGEELTIKEELAKVIKEGENLVNPLESEEIEDIVLKVKPMGSIIPIDRYKHRDVKRTLKADRKRLDREVELQYIVQLKSDNQVKNYNRMKNSEERKLTIKGILVLIMTWNGGVSAMLELMKALGGI